MFEVMAKMNDAKYTKPFSFRQEHVIFRGEIKFDMPNGWYSKYFYRDQIHTDCINRIITILKCTS